ncbi:hypothetical protein SGADD02_00264 [Streptococcus gallolyticus]|uniref:Uncharacterized protein n=1 Tax=Streptococcus gallolyticus TaxID=315405 RepID=A0A139R4B7_9STRE|nr:hypothetical protein SGADD02_00264 [Streptococcus gallolyticus]KXU09597.1 hypothetical protein SGADD03_00653 [Streptococcus gallolyticus]
MVIWSAFIGEMDEKFLFLILSLSGADGSDFRWNSMPKF